MRKGREGSGSLIVESFVLVGQDGLLLEDVDPKATIKAYALLRCNRFVQCDFHFSVQINDKHGTPVMVVRDSKYEDVISGGDGHYLVVSMSFSLPLQAGQYYCKTGVLLLPAGEKYKNGELNFEHAEVADLVEHAAYFKVLPCKPHPITVPVLNECTLSVSTIDAQMLGT